jgi:hypothetical protein
MAEQRIHDRLAPPTIAVRRILLLAVGTLAFLAATFAGLSLVFFSTVAPRRMPPPRTFPAPGLSAHPATELNDLLAAQRKALGSYRWANAEHTLVAIPIERAMKIIAERGAQGYAPVTAETPP